MKKYKNIFSKFVTLLIFLIVLNISAQNNEKNLSDSIKNEISKYLQREVQSVNITESLPDYKLYEIALVEVRTNIDKIEFKLKVSDFFNKNRFKFIYASVENEFPVQIKINSKVKLIYRRNNITLITDGIVEKIENNYIIVKTTYGKRLKCRAINQSEVEVIE